MKKVLSTLLAGALIILCVISAQSTTNMYGFTSFNGGTAGALDKLSSMANGDMAIGIVSGKFYSYTYSSNCTSATNTPYVVEPTSGTGCWQLSQDDVYYTSSYSSLAEAVNAINATAAKLIVDSAVTVPAANVTIPSTMQIEVVRGGNITLTGDLVVTGYFEAGPIPIFTGAGNVTFTGNISIVYPEWWGAAGNGTANDNEEWSMLAAAIPAGAEVHGVRGKTYYLNTAGGLVFSNKVILKHATFTTGATVGNAPTITLEGAGSIIENCKITGDATGWANDETTSTELRRNLQIKGNRTKVINNEIAEGIIGIDVYTGTTDVEIRGNYVHHSTVYSGQHTAYGASGCNYSAGIRMAGASRVYVSHNRVYGYGQNIACGYDADRLIIHDNDCESGDDNGIYLSSSTNVRVHHNRVKEFDSSGIKVRGSRQQIDHNLVSSPGGGAAGAGIAITGNGDPDAARFNGEDGIIDSNIVTGTYTGSGISVSEQDDGYFDNFIVTNNIIRLSGSDTNYGIRLAQGASTRGLVQGNSVTGHTIGLILQSGANVTFSGLIVDSNDFSGGSSHGIQVTGKMEYSKISNNNCRNASGTNKYGIYLLETTNSIIEDNDVRDIQANATQTYGIRESTNSTNNQYFNNNGKGNKNAPIELNSNTSRVQTNHTHLATLSANATLTCGEAATYIFDPGGANRNLTWRTATYPAGYLVTIINTADAAENLQFDANGINVTVAQNKTAIFGYTGSAWRQVTTVAP